MKQPVGKKVFIDFNISDSSTPTMGKQSQIIIFLVVFGRPDSGRCLRLFNPRSL